MNTEELIKANHAYFKTISNEAVAELENHKPCEKCKFLKESCYLTCGIAMKYISKKN